MDYRLSIRTGEAFMLIPVEEVYWVPGLASESVNDSVRRKRLRLKRLMRADESAAYDLQFNIATAEQIRLFGQRRVGYLVCAVLTPPDVWDEGYAFLEAEFTGQQATAVEEFCLAFVRQVAGHNARVLRQCPSGLSYDDKRRTLCFDSLPSERRPMMSAKLTALYVFLLRCPFGINRDLLLSSGESLGKIYRHCTREQDVRELSVTAVTLRQDIHRCNVALKAYFSRNGLSPVLLELYLIKRGKRGAIWIPIARNSRFSEKHKNLYT